MEAPTFSICAICANQHSSCCQNREIYITAGDCRRITEHTGRDDFWVYQRPTDPDYLDNDDDPIWLQQTFRADGSRRILKTDSERLCVFCAPNGCVLPLVIRPLLCRLYPYNFTENGILPDLDKGCPTELLGAGEDIIKAIGINPGEAQQWHRQLYQEIRQEPTC